MALCIQTTIPHKGGLPHSDTWGSKPARGSPQIFAACHVLHRLLAPRHPPDALLILITACNPSPGPHAPKPAMHRNHPHRNTNGCKQPPSHSKANPTQHTLFNIPEHCKDSALGAKHSARRIQHPGQTTHAKPSRTSRYSPEPHHRKAAPPKPTETSCASRNAPEPDSQFIKNTDPARPRDHPERTNEPRTPCPAQQQ